MGSKDERWGRRGTAGKNKRPASQLHSQLGWCVANTAHAAIAAPAPLRATHEREPPPHARSVRRWPSTIAVRPELPPKAHAVPLDEVGPKQLIPKGIANHLMPNSEEIHWIRLTVLAGVVPKADLSARKFSRCWTNHMGACYLIADSWPLPAASRRGVRSTGPRPPPPVTARRGAAAAGFRRVPGRAIEGFDATTASTRWPVLGGPAGGHGRCECSGGGGPPRTGAVWVGWRLRAPVGRRRGASTPHSVGRFLQRRAARSRGVWAGGGLGGGGCASPTTRGGSAGGGGPRRRGGGWRRPAHPPPAPHLRGTAGAPGGSCARAPRGRRHPSAAPRVPASADDPAPPRYTLAGCPARRGRPWRRAVGACTTRWSAVPPPATAGEG